MGGALGESTIGGGRIDGSKTPPSMRMEKTRTFSDLTAMSVFASGMKTWKRSRQ
jgi:hypothetical protein